MATGIFFNQLGQASILDILADALNWIMSYLTGHTVCEN